MACSGQQNADKLLTGGIVIDHQQAQRAEGFWGRGHWTTRCARLRIHHRKHQIDGNLSPLPGSTAHANLPPSTGPAAGNHQPQPGSARESSLCGTVDLEIGLKQSGLGFRIHADAGVFYLEPDPDQGHIPTRQEHNHPNHTALSELDGIGN